MAKIWKIEGLSLTLTQYIFCRSRWDKSIDSIKSEFYYLEHFLKIVKVGKNWKRTSQSHFDSAFQNDLYDIKMI